MGVRGVEHLGIVVARPADAAVWYREHLGFNVLRVGQEGDVAFIQCPATGLILELIREGEVNAAVRSLTHPLQVHLAVRTSAYESDLSRLLEAGAEFSMDCKTNDPEAKVCILKDPFGIFLQLAQRRDTFWE